MTSKIKNKTCFQKQYCQNVSPRHVKQFPLLKVCHKNQVKLPKKVMKLQNAGYYTKMTSQIIVSVKNEIWCQKNIFPKCSTYYSKLL